MSRRVLIIDGNNFSDIDGFYNEAGRVLTKDLTWKTGRNLNAFADLLRGGFGVHNYGEPICIRWLNSEKSRKDLGYKATVVYYKELLKNCHPQNIDALKSQIAAATAGTGETFFDLVVSAMEFEIRENDFDWIIELL